MLYGFLRNFSLGRIALDYCGEDNDSVLLVTKNVDMEQMTNEVLINAEVGELLTRTREYEVLWMHHVSCVRMLPTWDRFEDGRLYCRRLFQVN